MSMKKIVEFVPGIIFLFIMGLFAKYIGSLIPHVSYLIIAILLGIISANLVKLPVLITEGILKTHKLFLNTGIVILGARVLLKDIIRVGPELLLMIVVFIFFVLFLVEYLSKKFKIDPKLGSCLSSGSSVCGVSAVIATGAAIDAKKEHIAYAIATILTFDVITVFLYPLIGNLIASPQVYGAWTGVSMFSTGTTIAAGFAHSDMAGQIATIAKMVRNTFIGIWALLYSVYYVRKGLSSKIVNKASYLWNKFPKIIIGFIIVLFIANSGILSTTQLGYMKNAYNWLFMLAFVGLGYNMDLNELKKTGVKPFLIVLISFIIVSLLSLAAAFLLFK